MSKSTNTKYLLAIINLVLAFILSVIGNKVADALNLSMGSLLILLVITLFLCAVGLVEYENYLETGTMRDSLVARTGKSFFTATNKRLYSIPTRWSEMGSIFCLSLSLLITLSLVSYNANDTQGSFPTTNIRNWVGRVGAYVAATLFTRLGWFAVLAPLLLGLVSWTLFRGAIPGTRPRNQRRA